MAENTIVVVSEGKVVAWNLPAEGCALNIRANIDDSVWTTMFDYAARLDDLLVPLISISPNSNYLAAAWVPSRGDLDLNIYDTSTGKRLTGTTTPGYMPWFTPDGREVWCRIPDGSVGGWTIIGDVESGLAVLEPLGPTARPLGGSPWQSSRGYVVMCSEWVLNSSGERLLWLPRRWRMDSMRWSGRFLGLLDYESAESIILELDE